MRLTASVGRMGANKKHDIAVVQAALMNAKVGINGKPFWKGPIDGKTSKAFYDAITAYQVALKVSPANGTIQTICPTVSKTKNALKMGMRDLRALKDTAIVYVPVMGEREAEKQAKETIKAAPFPNREAKSIAAVQSITGKNTGLAMTRSRDFIGSDGCFATELDFVGVKWLDPRNGKVMPPGREPAEVANFIWKQFKDPKVWKRGSQNDLLFKSKLQLQSLKNRPTLGQQHLKALGLTNPPTNEILKALVVACARLLAREVKPATVLGQPEHVLILQAAEGVDKKVADAMRKAVDEFEASRGFPALPRGPGTVFRGDDIEAIDAAAIDGLLTCARITREVGDIRERGGDIFRVEGGFTYDTIEEGPADGNTVPPKISSRTLAWFHTHPPVGNKSRQEQDEQLSGIEPVAGTRTEQDPSDRKVIKQIRIESGDLPLSYLGTPSGKILRWKGLRRNPFTLKPKEYLKYK
ncbi:MAG: hypothetical protein V3R73_02850 [Sphingomonadales bacterium]